MYASLLYVAWHNAHWSVSLLLTLLVLSVEANGINVRYIKRPKRGESELMDKCNICRNICETELHHHLWLYFCDNCWAEFQAALEEVPLITKSGALLNIELNIIDTLYVKHNPEKTK